MGFTIDRLLQIVFFQAIYCVVYLLNSKGTKPQTRNELVLVDYCIRYHLYNNTGVDN
jgi:hypothetical protein